MVSLTINRDDFIAAQYLHLRWLKRDYLVVGLAYPIVLLMLYLSFMYFFNFSAEKVILFCVFGQCLFTAFFWLIYLPRRSRKFYDQARFLHESIELSWNEDTISLRGKGNWSELKWKDIRKWKQNDGYILLYETDLSFFLIPKRFLDIESTKAIEENLRCAQTRYISQ